MRQAARNKRLFLVLGTLLFATTLLLHARQPGGTATRPARPADAIVEIAIPEIVKEVRFHFDRHYVVPAAAGGKKKTFNGIEAIGKVGDRKVYVRLGIFPTAREAEAAIAEYFSYCAAIPRPIFTKLTQVTKIADASWQLGSSMLFRKGRVFCGTYQHPTPPRKDLIEFARKLEKAIRYHASPGPIVVDVAEAPAKMSVIEGEATIEIARQRRGGVPETFPAGDQKWLADLEVVAATRADRVCFEFRQGCLICGRTVVGARGLTRVWSKGRKATYLAGPGEVEMRAGAGSRLRGIWGKPVKLTVGKRESTTQPSPGRRTSSTAPAAPCSRPS